MSGPIPESADQGGEQTPLERQKLAASRIGYGAICLRRQGDYAIVEVEQDGRWIEVIREFCDSNFSHIVEPLGIEGAIKRAAIDEAQGER